MFNPYDGYAPPSLTLPRLRGREGWGRGLPVARRQTRRCLRVLRGRYQGRGTAPVLFERRQFGERAHPYGHVHRRHRAAPRHGRRPTGQGSGRNCAGGIHHSKQWRLDHVRQTPELTGCDTGDHRLAAITLRASPKSLHSLIVGSRGSLSNRSALVARTALDAPNASFASTPSNGEAGWEAEFCPIGSTPDRKRHSATAIR